MKRFLTCVIVLVLLAMPVVALADETVAEPAFTIDITQIIISVLGLVVSVVVAWIAKVVVPPVKKWLEEKTSEQTRKNVWNTIVMLVEAAEQVIQGVARGSERLAWVKRKLYEFDIDFDEEMIEAAVKEMKDKALTAISEQE